MGPGVAEVDLEVHATRQAGPHRLVARFPHALGSVRRAGYGFGPVGGRHCVSCGNVGLGESRVRGAQLREYLERGLGRLGASGDIHANAPDVAKACHPEAEVGREDVTACPSIPDCRLGCRRRVPAAHHGSWSPWVGSRIGPHAARAGNGVVTGPLKPLTLKAPWRVRHDSDSGQTASRFPFVLPAVLPVQGDDPGPSGPSLGRRIAFSLGLGTSYSGWLLLVGGIV